MTQIDTIELAKRKIPSNLERSSLGPDKNKLEYAGNKNVNQHWVKNIYLYSEKILCPHHLNNCEKKPYEFLGYLPCFYLQKRERIHQYVLVAPKEKYYLVYLSAYLHYKRKSRCTIRNMYLKFKNANCQQGRGSNHGWHLI